MSSLAARLANRTGTYFGRGDGLESGPFLARIAVQRLPNSGVSIGYEATSFEHGLQHAEHTLLVTEPDGRCRLLIAHSESPVVTDLVEQAAGSGRFEPTTTAGPFAMAVVISLAPDDELTYAWWWAAAGDEPVEQSRATVRRA